MSLRLEMLQVARLAPKVLGDAAELVANFIQKQQNPDGGFRDRKNESDLYYTAFALDSLSALQISLPTNVLPWVRKFETGDQLDFVHLCCLARCWAALADLTSCEFLEVGERIAEKLLTFRSKDCGFNISPGQVHGTAYGAFLGLGAFQDLRISLRETHALADSLKTLKCGDGGWSNDSILGESSTNSTAAAVALLRNLGKPIESSKVGSWLLAQAHPGGGFKAAPRAPIPDLLSTATALHALSGLEHDFSAIKEPTLDFIDSLWTNDGSFYGHWGEDTLDCEYTFYALLALGHLSL
jgi:prenyltransferase beta subunit